MITGLVPHTLVYPTRGCGEVHGLPPQDLCPVCGPEPPPQSKAREGTRGESWVVTGLQGEAGEGGPG